MEIRAESCHKNGNSPHQKVVSSVNQITGFITYHNCNEEMTVLQQKEQCTKRSDVSCRCLYKKRMPGRMWPGRAAQPNHLHLGMNTQRPIRSSVILHNVILTDLGTSDSNLHRRPH